MVRRTKRPRRQKNADWGLEERWHLRTRLNALYFHISMA